MQITEHATLSWGPDYEADVEIELDVSFDMREVENITIVTVDILTDHGDSFPERFLQGVAGAHIFDYFNEIATRARHAAEQEYA